MIRVGRASWHPGFEGQIGAASGNITPPPGIYARNWGASAHDTAEGAVEPLRAAALALAAPGRRWPLVLVSLDLGWWRDAAAELYVRDWLLRRLALPRSHLLLALSHTHSGPALGLGYADRPGGAYIRPYLESLRCTVWELAARAIHCMEPGILDWAYGACDLATNREPPESQGGEVLCGFHPGAPADDTLLVGRATSQSGRPMATIVNYACHPTTLGWTNALISPDYVGALRDMVQEATGAPLLFLQGASGDLAPRDQYTHDHATARRNGRRLGYSVLATLQGMLPPGRALEPAGSLASGAPLALWRETQRTPDGGLSARLVSCGMPKKPEWSVGDVQARLARCADRVERERLERRLSILLSLPEGRLARVPLWIWRLGEALLVAQPNEAYSTFQQALRRRFAATTVAVVNCANGPYLGYVPPEEAYRSNRYPGWQTPLAPGCDKRLLRAAYRWIGRILSPDGRWENIRDELRPL